MSTSLPTLQGYIFHVFQHFALMVSGLRKAIKTCFEQGMAGSINIKKRHHVLDLYKNILKSGFLQHLTKQIQFAETKNPSITKPNEKIKN